MPSEDERSNSPSSRHGRGNNATLPTFSIVPPEDDGVSHFDTMVTIVLSRQRSSSLRPPSTKRSGRVSKRTVRASSADRARSRSRSQQTAWTSRDISPSPFIQSLLNEYDSWSSNRSADGSRSAKSAQTGPTAKSGRTSVREEWWKQASTEQRRIYMQTEAWKKGYTLESYRDGPGTPYQEFQRVLASPEYTQFRDPNVRNADLLYSSMLDTAAARVFILVLGTPFTPSGHPHVSLILSLSSTLRLVTSKAIVRRAIPLHAQVDAGAPQPLRRATLCGPRPIRPMNPDARVLYAAAPFGSMCIVFYTLSQPGYRLILASNRDEYLDRPATSAAWHNFEPPDQRPSSSNGDGQEGWVLSGRDVGSPAAGTWLGMTRDLRIGVITNIRHPIRPSPPNPPSRGKLLKDFLAPRPGSLEVQGVQDYLRSHEDTADRYEGVNLLLFDLKQKGDARVGYLTNRPAPKRTDLSPLAVSSDDGLGTHGLSNSPLDMPFEKVTQGKLAMREQLDSWSSSAGSEEELVERMMDLLSQSIPLTSLADAALSTLLQPVQVARNPDIPLEAGQQGRWYGTRVSTVILVRDDGTTIFVERDRAVLVDGEVKSGTERRFDFSPLAA